MEELDRVGFLSDPGVMGFWGASDPVSLRHQHLRIPHPFALLVPLQLPAVRSSKLSVKVLSKKNKTVHRAYGGHLAHDVVRERCGMGAAGGSGRGGGSGGRIGGSVGTHWGPGSHLRASASGPNRDQGHPFIHSFIHAFIPLASCIRAWGQFSHHGL